MSRTRSEDLRRPKHDLHSKTKPEYDPFADEIIGLLNGDRTDSGSEASTEDLPPSAEEVAPEPTTGPAVGPNLDPLAETEPTPPAITDATPGPVTSQNTDESAEEDYVDLYVASWITALDLDPNGSPMPNEAIQDHADETNSYPDSEASGDAVEQSAAIGALLLAVAMAGVCGGEAS
jgi:hypothetical protein